MTVRSGERGMALMLALVLLVVVESALLLLSFALVAQFRGQREEARRFRLDVLADSAADAALAQLAAGDPGGLPPAPLGGGEIESRVELVGGNRYLVQARARYAGAERRLVLEVIRLPHGLWIESWKPQPIGPAAP